MVHPHGRTNGNGNGNANAPAGQSQITQPAASIDNASGEDVQVFQVRVCRPVPAAVAGGRRGASCWPLCR